MKHDGVETVSLMGFSDAWGDLATTHWSKGGRARQHQGAQRRWGSYARGDASVTGQVLKD